MRFTNCVLSLFVRRSRSAQRDVFLAILLSFLTGYGPFKSSVQRRYVG